MSQSRRSFVKKSALAIAGTALFSDKIFAAFKNDTVLSIQLYSVRDAMHKEPLPTLKKVAAMGYKNVEHANYVNRKFYGYTATEFKKVLDDLGMKMPSGHTVLGKDDWDAQKNDFTDKWKYTVDDAATVGQKYVISPWLDDSMRKNISDFKRYMDVFNKCGELCQKQGMKFGYHNHDFEFTVKLDGQTLYDLILDNTDPALVAQQMDIGNMYGAGGRALDILSRYPNRFELLHVKDEIKSGKGEMAGGYESTVLGKGVLPVKQICDDFKKKGGTIYYVVEQESYQGQDPVDAIREDYDAMKKWGY